MRITAVAVAAGLLMTACASSPSVTITPPSDQPAPESSSPYPSDGGTSLTPAPSSDSPPAVTGDGDIVTGLQAPWGIAFLPDGSALVSERDTATIKRVDDGEVTTVATIDDAQPGGEGGLLGLAAAGSTVFAYYTTAGDNRVVRMAWDGSSLSTPMPILTGIPKADIHNGGRLAIGPDGMLYVATGDAANPDTAQDTGSLAGKILRITPDGDVPRDNPFEGSPVLSLGHRNVQGLAFDAQDRLWASEFGQSDVDELNLIERGRNYGWPTCEGACRKPAYVDPIVQWKPTSIASPSGVAIVDGYAYVASLRGEVLWQVPLSGAHDPVALELGDLGRLRTVVVAPDGALWLSTSNTDGRGNPRDGDDRLVRVVVR